MSDILKYIKLGTNAKEWFNYDGTPLPIRPLSSYEIDQIMETIIKEGITQSTFENIYKIKLDLAKKEEVDLSNKTKYREYLHYLNEYDYWVVYHAMKDFQPEEFSQPDFDSQFMRKYDDWKENYPKGYYIIRSMKYVHKIAEDVIHMSSAPHKELVGILRTKSGKLLASIVYYSYTPLAHEAWKLTPLQQKFLIYSAPGAPIALESEDELPGIKEDTLVEIAKKLNMLKGSNK